MHACFAPAGWGWRPGALLAADDAVVLHYLPELPLLPLFRDSEKRNLVVQRAVADADLVRPFLRPKHIERKYGLNRHNASRVFDRIHAGTL